MNAYGALLCTLLFTATSQILQKLVARKRAIPTHQAISALTFYWSQPQFWLALSCLGLAMLCWLYALTKLPLGSAYTLLSANYVIVLVAARVWLHEHVSARQWVGAVVLVAGLIVMGHG